MSSGDIKKCPEGGWWLTSKWDINPTGSTLRIPMMRSSYTRDKYQARAFAKKYGCDWILKRDADLMTIEELEAATKPDEQS